MVESSRNYFKLLFLWRRHSLKSQEKQASPIFRAEVSEVKFFPRCWKHHWTVLADTSHQCLRNDRLEWWFPFSQLSGYHTAQPPWGSFFFQGAIEKRLQLTVEPQIQEERCRVYPGRRTEDRVIGKVMKFSPSSVLIQYFVEKAYNRVPRKSFWGYCGSMQPFFT